jgi:hypothetical protein
MIGQLFSDRLMEQKCMGAAPEAKFYRPKRDGKKMRRSNNGMKRC